MKNSMFLIVLIPFYLFSQQSDSTKTEKSFKIVPLITSSPLMGLGLGFSTSYLYHADQSKSSKSQFSVGGQYSSTKSYALFARNSMWLKNNNISSTTDIGFTNINNEFEDKIFGDVRYNIKALFISEVLMFKVANNFYLGTPLSYTKVNYSPINNQGDVFINNNGILDVNAGGIGVSGSFDSRKNKYFPTNSSWISATINSNPAWLGSIDSYYSFVIDARKYISGFREKDVWAWQFYGQYSSDKTPDSGLPGLSGKNLLRGYPNGQFKAKYLTGAQTEYRYTIDNSRFRAVGFFGVANLSGGSYGTNDKSRNNDGWYTAEGLGLRYILQQITGVDLRLDFVHTSQQQFAFYLALNQAF